MKDNIRLFTLDDYVAFADLLAAVYPEYPDAPDDIRHWDSIRDPKIKFKRWVVKQDDRLIAFAEHNQFSGMYHPRKFIVEVGVHPDFRRQGIGSALYDCVVDALQPHDPLTLRSRAREDWSAGLRFLQQRGYEEGVRDWESRLDVMAFDPTPYAGLDEQMHAQGIEIKTLRELESDPDRDRKLYDLFTEARADVPRPEPATLISYEQFIKDTFENPNLMPEGYLIAVEGDAYIGMSNLWTSHGNDDIYTGLTAVRRSHRRKGIALALKVRGIKTIKARGNPIIKTWNASVNRPMLAINEQLGYVKQPVWIDFVKVLKEELAPEALVELAA